MPQGSTFVQPTRTRFRTCTINGVNLLLHVTGMNVYETIFKPYLTAKLTILDNNGIIQNMKLVGKEPVSIAFDGAQGDIYSAQLHVMNIKGEKSNQSLRSQLYTIDCIGPAYFKDQGSMVQQAFKGVTGTQAIQSIHSQFLGGDAPLKILEHSLGMLSDESFISSSIKPFKAINDIRSRLNFASARSGNCLYFRDAASYVLAPLETLFQQLSAQEEFIQEATWGKNWFDIIRAERAIISCVAEVDHAEGGSASQVDLAQAHTQEKQVFDFRLKDVVTKKIASAANLGALAGAINGLGAGFGFGNLGGMPNYQTMDSAHNQKQVDRSDKTERERVYGAAVKNGPKLTLKVPIQSGIRCTVGKGINCKLIPAMGDQNNVKLSAAGGMVLVTDLCHELHADDRTVSGTTTFQTVKGGLS